MATVGSGKHTYELVEGWAKMPPGDSIAWASMISTDSQDRVYVIQRNAEPSVLVFDREGNYVNGWGIGTFNGPHGIYIEKRRGVHDGPGRLGGVDVHARGEAAEGDWGAGEAFGHWGKGRTSTTKTTWCPGPRDRSTFPAR